MINAQTGSVSAVLVLSFGVEDGVADTMVISDKCIGLKNECCDGFCFKVDPDWEEGWCLPKLRYSAW
jgi:hypothetical protein